MARATLPPSRTLKERATRAKPTTTRTSRAAPTAKGALAGRAAEAAGRSGGGFSAVGRGFEDMMNHRAVSFGREMTAGPGQGAIDRTVADVRARLAEQGIYKDDLGTFQISGMERTDPGRAIRDAAIAGMDPSGDWAAKVAFSESQLNPEGGWARPAPRGTNTAERAIPGPSDVLTARAAEIPTSASRPTTSSRPTIQTENTPPGQGVPLNPSPSRPTIQTENTPPGQGVPITPPAPLPTSQPGHQQTGRAIQPPVSSNPLAVPGHQQTGRATPLGTTVQAPGTGPAPRQTTPPVQVGEGGGTSHQRSADEIFVAQNIGGRTPGPSTGGSSSGAPALNVAGGSSAPSTTTTPTAFGQPSAGATQSRASGYASPQSQASQEAANEANRQMTPVGGHVPGVATPTTTKAAPVSEGGGRIQPTSDILPAGLGGTGDLRRGTATNQPTFDVSQPVNIQTENSARPGQPANQPPIGRPAPTVPGPTTASVPGGKWPTDKLGPFGTDDGGTSMFPPGFPFNDRPRPGTGTTNLAGLGASISQRVNEAISGRGGGVAGGITPGASTPIAGLEGLGDRIRQVVEQGQRDMQSRMPNLTMPGGPSTIAPTNPGAPAPGPGYPQPPSTAPSNPGQPTTSGGGTLGSYGNASVDQWDSAFIAAGQATGVDPTTLKAMMEIESGGNGNMSMDQCRDDGYGDGLSCGPMQIKGDIWGHSATVEDQIMKAATILADYKAAHPGATDEDALFAVYFPGNDPNGTTPGSYGARVAELKGQMGPYTPGSQTLPPGQQAVDANGVPIPPGGVPAGPSSADPSTIDPQVTGQETPPGTGVPPATPPSDGARYPVNSSTLDPQMTPANGITPGGYSQGDGMGIYAGPNADETWMQIMHPSAVVTSDYKQNVCTEGWSPGCCTGGHCDYNSNLILAGASNTVHPGYDVAMAPGTTFSAPMGGEIIGTSGNASDPRCISPAGTNECTWAYDYGIVMDGGMDPQGNQIYINYDHVTGGSLIEGQVGQYVEGGTPLGVVGGAAHIHVEAHAYCPALGKMVVLDPSLIYGGYYSSNSVCSGHV